MGFSDVRSAQVSISRLFAAILISATLGWSAFGHELGLVQAEALFHRDGTYALDFLVDLEHLPADTAPAIFLRDIERGAVLSFDGKVAKHGRAEVLENADGKAGVTRLRLTGRRPPGASTVTFSNRAITDYHLLRLRSEGQQAPVTQWIEGGKSSAPFPLDRVVAPPTRGAIILQYLILGFTHILPYGLDHVLFVLGIFLLGTGLRPVLWQVSAFTVAHTITLALTIYGFVSLPATVVEPLIALSIVYVAIENVFTTKLHAWRPLIVFCFGLLHGMGFAGVLSEIGLPRSEFVPALLAFNVGVEGGQLAVILAAFLLLGLPFRRKEWYRRRIVVPLSLAIAAIGLYWFVERVSG